MAVLSSPPGVQERSRAQYASIPESCRNVRGTGYASTEKLAYSFPESAVVDRFARIRGGRCKGRVFMGSRLAMGLAFLVMVGALALAPLPARAGTSDETLRKDFPKPDDNPALEQWRNERVWRYNTEYIFGVTRGLKNENIPTMCERAAWIVTVPFDIANLPFTALAGLFGD
jgi:hypothetical protein